MSHFTCLVIVADAVGEEQAIATAERMLERYNEEREVEAYRKPFASGTGSARNLRWLREYADREFNVSPQVTLAQLAQYVEAYTGNTGVYDPDENALYEITTYNPESKWDWHEVGGRWDGALPGGQNILPISDLLAVHDQIIENGVSSVDGWPSFAIVTPNGEWHERGHMVYFGIALNQKALDLWTQEADALLLHWADLGGVGVLFDCHI